MSAGVVVQQRDLSLHAPVSLLHRVGHEPRGLRAAFGAPLLVQPSDALVLLGLDALAHDLHGARGLGILDGAQLGLLGGVGLGRRRWWWGERR